MIYNWAMGKSSGEQRLFAILLVRGFDYHRKPGIFLLGVRPWYYYMFLRKGDENKLNLVLVNPFSGLSGQSAKFGTGNKLRSRIWWAVGRWWHHRSRRQDKDQRRGRRDGKGFEWSQRKRCERKEKVLSASGITFWNYEKAYCSFFEFSYWRAVCPVQEFSDQVQ